MREISPAVGVSVDEWLAQAPPEIKVLVAEIRREKQAGERLKPSDCLIDRSNILTPEQRKMLIDKIAELVDENCCGRSEMCQQFASLMYKALSHLGISSRIVTGTSVYYDSKGGTVYRWPDDGHDWVSIGDEIIDGNVDSLPENPYVPKELKLQPYWGPRKEAPRDRKFNQNPGARTRELEEDVETIWWPDLKAWIEENITLP